MIKTIRLLPQRNSFTDLSKLPLSFLETLLDIYIYIYIYIYIQKSFKKAQPFQVEHYTQLS